ncbi:MAG: hypothetical protein ACTS1Z_03680 [Parasphingopyxis sp.]|uniref:hypothetical protein n=1 Tax=Parasphingopyxis sp. TaxID=1920299 RepID=UPI003F9EE6BD
MSYLIAYFWLSMLLSIVIGVATGASIWRRPAQARSADDLVYPAPAESAPARPEPEPEPEVAPEPVPETPPEPEPVADVEPAEEPAPKPETAQAAVPSPFLDRPDGEPDRLTLIKGVGPKLGDMLHDLGVYHFAQIAGWDEAQIAEVDSRLGSFKGRITRDRWVDQARLLAARNVAAFEREFGKMNGPL